MLTDGEAHAHWVFNQDEPTIKKKLARNSWGSLKKYTLHPPSKYLAHMKEYHFYGKPLGCRK